MIDAHSALLLIDLQNDFCPDGSLAVPEGDQVIAIANQLMPYFKTIIATQDWHPHNHSSFESLWPVHCVQGTRGAQFHNELILNHITKIIQKGTDNTIDSYSAFYDNQHLKNTGLTQWLRENHIATIYVMGLATEYCVLYSVMDAIADGFNVYVITDGCRGIDLHAGDVAAALNKMQEKGARLISSKQISG